jgi:hypothetical protein
MLFNYSLELDSLFNQNNSQILSIKKIFLISSKNNNSKKHFPVWILTDLKSYKNFIIC